LLLLLLPANLTHIPQVLDCSDCRSLGKLPGHTFDLKSLQKLILKGCSTLQLSPKALCQLCSLELLDLTGRQVPNCLQEGTHWGLLARKASLPPGSRHIIHDLLFSTADECFLDGLAEFGYRNYASGVGGFGCGLVGFALKAACRIGLAHTCLAPEAGAQEKLGYQWLDTLVLSAGSPLWNHMCEAKALLLMGRKLTRNVEVNVQELPLDGQGQPREYLRKLWSTDMPARIEGLVIQVRGAA
jgi:hypothetical protein